jgi:hypothetical protein
MVETQPLPVSPCASSHRIRGMARSSWTTSLLTSSDRAGRGRAVVLVFYRMQWWRAAAAVRWGGARVFPSMTGRFQSPVRCMHGLSRQFDGMAHRTRPHRTAPTINLSRRRSIFGYSTLQNSQVFCDGRTWSGSPLQRLRQQLRQGRAGRSPSGRSVERQRRREGTEWRHVRQLLGSFTKARGAGAKWSTKAR